MMDISSSTSIAAQVNNRVNSVSNQQQTVQRVERELEKNSNQQNQQSQRTERFDVDPQALALVEQEYQNSLSGQFIGADNNSANNAVNTAYDSPSEQNQTAISAYQSVDNLAQQESVKQLFGVDLYA